MEIRKKRIYEYIIKKANEKNHFVEFFSHTKIDNYVQCQMQYKYKFIDKIKSEFKDNIYTDMGTLAHDLTEKYITHKEINRKELLDDYEIQSIHFANLNGIPEDFPLITSLKHYIKYSSFLDEKRNSKSEFEVPLYLKLKEEGKKEYWYVGFIDMIEHNEDGTVNLYDFKISNKSGYTGKKLNKASIQLYTYAYLYEKLYNKKVKSIKYVFLKYCDISFKDSNNKDRKTSGIERCKIKDEFEKKDGKSNLTINDNILELTCSDDIKRDYMKKFINLFVEIKNKKNYTVENKDDGYCLKFCEYRKNGHCKEYEKSEDEVKVMLEMFKVKLKNEGVEIE